MQLSSIPVKFLIPFAKNAGGSYFTEVPATTADPTLASQSLGFPPLTMQPLAAGGVPPQGPDVNGAMNQIARTAWWLMAGGKYLYDSSWAADSNIGGYPAGADILDAGGTYVLRSRINNNTSNPTGNTGNWSTQTNPGYEIANPGTAITLTDVQAASSYLRVTGAVAASCTITLQPLPTGGRAPLRFTFAHDATGSAVTLTTGVGTPLVVNAGFVATVQQRNDGSLFAANVSAGGSGGGISAPALSVGSAGAAAGTIAMQGSEYRSNGILRQWCTIQLNSPGTGPVTVNWTYPIAYASLITSIRGTNLSRPAGQVSINGAEGAVLCSNLPGLTSVGLTAEGTQNTSALCWFLVEVEGL